MYTTPRSQNMTTVSGTRTTPFGAVENPALLRQLTGTTVLRFDTLVALRDLWGDNILMSRQHIYELVSGTVSDKRFQELMASYYKRYAAFANYVDEAYLFGNRELPLVVRVIQPAREAIRLQERLVITRVKEAGGTYLGTHQDYAYASFKYDREPMLEGCVRIC